MTPTEDYLHGVCYSFVEDVKDCRSVLETGLLVAGKVDGLSVIVNIRTREMGFSGTKEWMIELLSRWKGADALDDGFLCCVGGEMFVALLVVM